MVPVILRCERSEPPSRLLGLRHQEVRNRASPILGRGHGPGPSPARSARFPPPQAGEGGERSSPGEGRQGRASFKQVPRPPQDDRKQQRFSTPSLSVAVESPSGGGKPTTMQDAAVTGDEADMRVDRFLEAKFPGCRSRISSASSAKASCA